MGSSVNTAVTTAVQTSVNNVFQEAQTICKADVSQEQRGINVYCAGECGDVTFAQVASANADCTIKTNLDTISAQQLDSVQTAQASDPGKPALITWPGFSVNTSVNTIVQTLSNSTTQVINNVCESNVSQTQADINVYTTENGKIGNITFSQDANASASCGITNQASSSSNQSAGNNQSANSSSGSVAVLIVALLVVALIVIAVVWLVFSNKSKNKQQELSLCTPTPCPTGLSCQPCPTGQTCPAGVCSAGLTCLPCPPPKPKGQSAFSSLFKQATEATGTAKKAGLI